MQSGTLDAQGIADLIDLLMEPTPATYVRQVLCLYRDRGWDFEQAWAQAMRTLPRHLPDMPEWRANFHAQKPRWHVAYDTPQTAPAPLAA